MNFKESKPIYYYKNGNTRVTKKLKGNDTTKMIGTKPTPLNTALHRFKITLKFVQKQQQQNLEFSRKISEIRNQSKSQFNAICNIEEKKEVTNSELQKELQELKEMISNLFKSKQ